MKKFNPVCYTTADFSELRFNNVFHKENEAVNSESPIKNYHCLARAVYTHRAGENAIMRITADDFYKLYINGRYICEGPAPSFHYNYYYNELDISKYLDDGENIIAVHLYYQGLINRVWQSGDNRFCLCCDINGSCPEWRYSVSRAYSGSINGYNTDFTENFNSSLWNNGWCNKDFDDSEWQPMLERAYDYSFVRQPTEVIRAYKIKPEAIVKTDYGYFIDAAQEIAGGISLVCNGNEGDAVTILFGEEADERGSARYKLRANCTYSEKWLLGKGESRFESFYYKGFRYVQIITENELSELEIICRHYPFDDDYCKPAFKDKRAEQIFNLCKSTIKFGVQDGFIDCPTREKGQYLGDTFIAGHSHALLTGKTDLLEKSLDDFAATSRICSGLMAVAPCSLMQEIADYSLLFGELVLLAYRLSGNTELLKKHYHTAKNIILHFSHFARADGLLDTVSDKWNLVDWPEAARDNYDFELSRPIVSQGAHNVINAYYIGAVKTLNEAEEILGIEKSFDFEKLRSAYIAAFFKNGLFADSEHSEHKSLHSNTFALYFGLVPKEHITGVCDYIVSKGLSCGVYVSYFVLKALSGAGRGKDAFNLLVNSSEHGWLNMLKEGATTCFEVWGKEQKHNTSLCHPWATAPVCLILEDLRNYALSENE